MDKELKETKKNDVSPYENINKAMQNMKHSLIEILKLKKF